jgi:hemerythrin
MQLLWTRDLSVGVEEIDSQHKELFKMINDLDAAIKKGKAKKEIGELIGFLDGYIVNHFSTEEKYMTAWAYPDYPYHRKKHEWFIEEFAGIKKKLEDGAPLVEIIGLSNNLLITWFSNHIRTTDKVLGGFLASKNKCDSKGSQ